jgi:hypothetical protein
MMIFVNGGDKSSGSVAGSDVPFVCGGVNNNGFGSVVCTVEAADVAVRVGADITMRGGG